MSIMDELKRLTRPYEDEDDEYDEYEDDYEEEYDEPEEEPTRNSRRSERSERSERSSSGRSGMFGGQSSNSKDNVTPIKGQAQIQVVLVKPEKYSNVSEVADHLLANRTVVLNLEKTEKNVSRRLLDFLSGVAYANNGKIQPIAASTYLITPINVEFQGELKEEITRNPMFK